jgi:transcription initiation factor TFIID subunit 12
LVGKRIQDLLHSIDPNYTLEPDAEEQILQIADDFLDKVTRQSIRLAQHRGSQTLDVQDIQVVLAKHWGISVPGLGLPTIKPLKPGKATISKTVTPSNVKRKSTGGDSSASRKKVATGTTAGS